MTNPSKTYFSNYLGQQCYQVKDGVGWLTLQDAASGNTVSAVMAVEMADACCAFSEDEEARVLVVTGAGDVFCVGDDSGVHPVASLLAGLTRPVIAAINGAAIGQGLEIALAADIRIAAATARFAMPQVLHGGFPTDGGSQRLPRLVGKAKALELMLTGDEIDAAEALRIGLVGRVYPADELMSAVEKLALELSRRAPVSMLFTREAVYQGLDMTLEEGLHLEADLYSLLQTTGDRSEGIRAFIEKRRAVFEGE